MTAVWDLDLPDSQKIVLLALADCANDEGLCWPSMATLSKKCSKSERTVQGVIKELVAGGHLGRQEVPGKGCKYVVHPRSGCTPAEPAPPQRTTPTPAAAADKPSRTVNEGLADANPKRARKLAAEIIIPDWVPAEPWAGFMEMRRVKGVRPTPRAVSLLIGKLERWRAQGHDPGEILNKSTTSNWTDIYEPKAPANDRQSASNDEPRNAYVRSALRRQAERAGTGVG